MIRPRPVIHDDGITVPLESIGDPSTFARPQSTRDARRQIIDARRVATAAECLAPLTRDNELFGFTKGQFSLLDLIKATLAKTGPADVAISTWTAARAEVSEMAAMKKRGELTNARWLGDISMAGRDRGVVQAILQNFGHDAIRVTRNHAKFCLFRNRNWRVVLWSSMNLNMNPRMENFWIAHDLELADFLESLLAEIWTKQKFSLDGARQQRKAWSDGSI